MPEKYRVYVELPRSFGFGLCIQLYCIYIGLEVKKQVETIRSTSYRWFSGFLFILVFAVNVYFFIEDMNIKKDYKWKSELGYTILILAILLHSIFI